MAMIITFDEAALRTISDLPMPSLALNSAEATTRASNDLIALVNIGRVFLRSCVFARNYQVPVPNGFENQVDFAMGNARLANITVNIGLLERLNLDGVATDVSTAAMVLLAYIGASFQGSFHGSTMSAIHNSINEICTMLLEDHAINVQ